MAAPALGEVITGARPLGHPDVQHIGPCMAGRLLGNARRQKDLLKVRRPKFPNASFNAGPGPQARSPVSLSIQISRKTPESRTDVRPGRIQALVRRLQSRIFRSPVAAQTGSRATFRCLSSASCCALTAAGQSSAGMFPDAKPPRGRAERQDALLKLRVGTSGKVSEPHDDDIGTDHAGGPCIAPAVAGSSFIEEFASRAANRHRFTARSQHAAEDKLRFTRKHIGLGRGGLSFEEPKRPKEPFPATMA